MPLPYLLALLYPLLGLLRGEHDLPHGSPRAGGQALRQRLELQLGVDHGVQQLVQLLRLHTADRLVLLKESLLHHVHGNLHRSEGRALAIPEQGRPRTVRKEGEGKKIRWA